MNDTDIRTLKSKLLQDIIKMCKSREVKHDDLLVYAGMLLGLDYVISAIRNDVDTSELETASQLISTSTFNPLDHKERGGG